MKGISTIVSFIIIVSAVYLSFSTLMPQSNEDEFVPSTEFSVDRAMTPLLEITKKPHYTGSEGNEEVRSILIAELHKLGLEPHIQENFVVNPKAKTLTKPINIVAKYPGTSPGKAVLLLSHYDSALVPSFGAADAASGVVAILESMRAFLASGVRPKNDIVILFTDAEELGLDGARLFVNEHPWAKNVGVVFNFEARGSGGPSNMILETTQGNSSLVKEFVTANPNYPVASSLMYSVYKLLPNDTDSTIFREEGGVGGFFFAFIDNHFHYHTELDTYYNLDRNSLAHQGSYLLPLLTHFSQIELSGLESKTDLVYFNFPIVKMIYYPFSWIFPLLIVASLLFIGVLIYGIYTKKLVAKSIGKGFVIFLATLILNGLIGFLGWKSILMIYPDYREIQQGFPYNGHWYIAFFVALSLFVTLGIYSKKITPDKIASYLIAPVAVWLLINVLIAIYLPGAAYFIISVFIGILMLALLLFKSMPTWVMSIFTVPVLLIFSPLVQYFPVGLGLNSIMISLIMMVLLIGFLIPIWNQFRGKPVFYYGAFLFSIFFFIKAHTQSDFSETRKKPNSLVYFEDTENDKAYWTTYDKTLDKWTSKYISESDDLFPFNSPYSKYGVNYQAYKETDSRQLESATIEILFDSIIGNDRTMEIRIIPNRRINLMELQSVQMSEFHTVKINGKTIDLSAENKEYRGTANESFLRYILPYAQDPLNIELVFDKDHNYSFNVLEYSFDLMDNPLFSMEPRERYMMPKPFIVTDAVITRRILKID